MKIRVDLTNKRFGKLVAVIPTDERNNHGSIIWKCQCDCGNIKYTSSEMLLGDHTKSCGCFNSKWIDGNRTHKKCPKCNIDKNINDFPKNKYNKDNHHTYCKECTSIRNKINGKKYREQINKHLLYKYYNDKDYKILHSLRNRIRLALLNNQKFGNTLTLLGCSISEFKCKLEKQFTENMNWGNYGSFWEMDHIKPCSKFDLSNINEQKKCFHYSNLQPLSCTDNRIKGNTYNE